MSVVDVSEIIEDQKLSRFLVGLVTISWIITFFDGLDANLISFAASYFRKDYHLTTAQTGNIFAMHQVGTLLGGFVPHLHRGPGKAEADGDPRDPRPLASSRCAFTSQAATDQLFSLRLIDGFPLGGMLPLAWALNIEYAPTALSAPPL